MAAGDAVCWAGHVEGKGGVDGWMRSYRWRGIDGDTSPAVLLLNESIIRGGRGGGGKGRGGRGLPAQSHSRLVYGIRV